MPTRRAFVSYRHESESHRKAVLAFCQRLNATLGDVSVEIVNDQTLLDTRPAGPDEGWNRWSMNMAAHAERVIAIVSPGWFAAMDQKELKPPPGGRGSAVEATVIFNRHTDGRTVSPWLRLVRLPTFPETETNWLMRDIPVFLGDNEADIQALGRWIRSIDGSEAAGPSSPGSNATTSSRKSSASARRAWLLAAAATVPLIAFAAWMALKPPAAPTTGSHSTAPTQPPTPPSSPPSSEAPAIAATTPATATTVAASQKSPTPPANPAPGAEWQITLNPTTALRFRWCPPGTFTMGRTTAEFTHLADFGLADQPRVRDRSPITLPSGFWIAENELTQAELAALRGQPAPENPRLPATGLTHPEARELAEKLNLALALPSLAARLPTEAEWEYACRAGTETTFSFGPTLDATQANFDPTTPMPGTARRLGRKKAIEAGTFPANPWNLLDMHGNVSEWCLHVPTESPTATPPPDAHHGRFPARGGHWDSYWIACTAGARNYLEGSQASPMTGLRFVLAQPTPP